MSAVTRGGKLRVLVSIAIALTLMLPVVAQVNTRAYADGLFMETFSASLKGRDAQLSVNVNPPILTTATQQDAYIQFRLYDSKTNETIKFSTWDITVEKGIGSNSQKLLREVFHTESGLLKMKVQPQQADKVTILANQEPYLNAWMADPGGTINLRGPIFLEGGLYHFRISILGIDSIRSLFPDDQVQTFDSWLSVGDVFNKDVDYQGQSYNTTIISYYDRIKQFNFNQQNKTFDWAMPFDWNTSRIDKTTMFVHEEVKLPKSMAGIGDSAAFRATVNSVPISGAKLVLDPYSSQTELILHYLLNKPDVLSLAQKVPQGSNQMTFALTPSSQVENTTTTEMSTDAGGVHVNLQWSPDPLNAGSQSTVNLQFTDAFTGKKFDNGDVSYSLKILDSKGGEVYSKDGLTAKGGTDTQTIDFPSNSNYRIEVHVGGVSISGGTLDKTRSGVARGLVVVPEFPLGAALAAAALIGSLLVMQRVAGGRPLKKGWD